LKGWVVTVDLIVDEVTDDPGEKLRSDPEVRRARAIAEAARCELVNCVTVQSDLVDLAEATRMLAALHAATALAQDAEDRVLVHNALLTRAEASRRTKARQASLARRAGVSSRPVQGSRRAVPTRLRAARLRASLPFLLTQPRRATATSLAAALTVAGITALVVIAKGRLAKAA
jgi:hypothetical protein